jgi:hypothetical protein
MAFAPLAISAGLSLVQAGQKRKAGEIAAQEAEFTAGQVELGATQREADRKEVLARAMASQTASAGARGISAFEGSPLSILEADIAAEETATERDIFTSELEAMTLRARGQVAKQAAKTSAFTGLVGDFASLAATA